ncbi:hypothetical protein HA147_06695 [Prochlorococcus marinus XMU1410]|uniref:hypothetical protein n=1 Tax=Prochlorococcus marinus TaxID=1219 RepID=UPI001ADA9DFB|nr:hypothetical protein [Prochlorococcus marinus]MBO8242337.1 hypothetical protein [Prochlorococcus marinus XMU1410]MBW3053484.1 hypothetical protein [Prochlorococcus marinus str. MU1410]
MARRLTEEQIEKLIKCFEEGTSIDLLSQKFNCTKLTVIRNLKKNLGEFKYIDLLNKNKSLIEKSRTNKIQSGDLLKTNIDKVVLIKDSNEPKVLDENVTASNDHKFLNENINASNFDPYDSFLEIAPLDYEIDNLSRKELTSVPISEVDFPKVVYMIVDKKIELEIKLLKDFPKWDFLPDNDLKRKTIEIFFDLNLAKRSCNKEQKVLKVPNTDVFRMAAPILLEKGISRIVCPENLIAL